MTRALNEEEIRVLRAAESLRLMKSGGQWRIVLSSKLPNKRAREHLQRSGLIVHPVLADGTTRTNVFVATEKGSAALDAYDDVPF